MEVYRVQNPLPSYTDHLCLHCGTIYDTGDQSPPYKNYHRDDMEHAQFQLCRKCYVHLYFTATKQGQKQFEERMRKEIPQLYVNRGFRDFDVSGPYGHRLVAARDDVIAWTQAVLSHKRVSYYLFSEFQSPSFPGTAAGKTLLACNAFQYIARRRRNFDGVLWDADHIDLPCAFIDLEALVLDFLRQRKRDPEVKPEYPVTSGSGMYRSVTFDEHIANLAHHPILFLDDIGQGSTTGMLPAVYEELLDMRARWEGPTFFTSNFSLDSLVARIGSRAVSRLRRLNCVVRELQVPDYHALREKGDVRSMIPGARK